MNRKRTIRAIWIAIALIAIVTWAGCAGKTEVHGVRPAEVSMGGIKTMAVLKFDGKYGETVRSDLYSKLDEVKHFNLIDTSQVNTLDKVVFDQIDDQRFLPDLEALHADGVITARVAADVKDIPGVEQVEMKEGTGKYEEEKNIFGQTVKKEVMKTVIKPVRYVIRQSSMTADFKVFDLKTKRILATEKVTETFNEKFGGVNEHSSSDKKLNQLPSKRQTINELSGKIAARFAAKISPTKFVSKVAFASDKNKMVKKGIKYAKEGAWEEAREIWEDVTRAEPSNAAAYYNLGVAYERYGDLASLNTANKYYKLSARYGDKKLYIKAVGRMTERIKESRKLEKQRSMQKQTPEKKSQDSGGIRIY